MRQVGTSPPENRISIAALCRERCVPWSLNGTRLKTMPRPKGKRHAKKAGTHDKHFAEARDEAAEAAAEWVASGGVVWEPPVEPWRSCRCCMRLPSRCSAR